MQMAGQNESKWLGIGFLLNEIRERRISRAPAFGRFLPVTRGRERPISDSGER